MREEGLIFEVITGPFCAGYARSKSSRNRHYRTPFRTSTPVQIKGINNQVSAFVRPWEGSQDYHDSSVDIDVCVIARMCLPR